MKLLRNPYLINDLKKLLITGNEYSVKHVKEVLLKVLSDYGYFGTTTSTKILDVTIGTTKVDTYKDGIRFKGYKIGTYKTSFDD